MGWIAEMKARQARQEYGIFDSADWERFLEVANLDHIIVRLTPTLPAFVYDDTVVVNETLSRDEACWWVWHEIGHVLLHAGDRNFWSGRPQGDITVAKFEQQADTFAATFPEWDESAVSFLPTDLRILNK
jgi:hypothetical protein